MPFMHLDSVYFCPISHQLMSDPVIAADGHTYERAAIETWLCDHDMSPVTKEILPNKTLIPNHSVKLVIQKLREEKHICSHEEFWVTIKHNATEALSQLNFLQDHLMLRDEKNRSPLLFACENGFTHLVKYLVLNCQADCVTDTDSEQNTALHLAAMYGNQELMDFLLSQGAIIEAKNKFGYTPLHSAAWKGSPAVIESLLAHKANIEALTIINRTPLLFSAQRGDVEGIQILLKYKAQIQVKNKNGLTPLHYAALNGHSAAIEFLLAQSCDIEAKNKNGDTPLHYAAQRGQVEAIKILLAHKANIEANVNGATPLHVAVMKGHTETVNVLLAHQANIEANVNGVTPLHLAAKQGHTEVVRALLAHHADIGARNITGKTPRDLALEKGHKEIANLLAPTPFTFFQPSTSSSAAKPSSPFSFGSSSSATKPSSPFSFGAPSLTATPSLFTFSSSSSTAKPNSPLNVIDAFGRFQISLDIPWKDLIIGKELGRGGFGIVYQGTYRFNDVAIKQLLVSNLSENALSEFRQEASHMANLRSPNIVQLYGVCVKPGYYAMVMEYMPKGSLFNFLHSKEIIGWAKQHSIALDIAKGVAFLHHEDITHRDLKSLNILLNNADQAKLCDFGLATLKTETCTYRAANASGDSEKIGGSIPWMAPELFKPNSSYIKACDIYSLGIILWELASQKSPWASALSAVLIIQWVSAGQREQIPMLTPPLMADLIRDCWDQDPHKRPTSEVVVNELQRCKP